MGYAWNGKCFQDAAGALAAFSEDVPSATPQGINAFTAVPSINGTGLITWSISNRPLSGTAATVRTGTTQLQSCSSESLDQWPVQSILFFLALFFAMVVGFKTGFKP